MWVALEVEQCILEDQGSMESLDAFYLSVC